MTTQPTSPKNRTAKRHLLACIATLSLCTLASQSLLAQAAPADTKEAESAGSLKDVTYVFEVKPNIDDQTGETIPLTEAAMDTAKTIFEKRLNEAGVLDCQIAVKKHHIEVKLFNIQQTQATALKTALTTQSKLTIHKRHPQSDTLAPLVFKGEETVVGYKVYPQEIKDAEGRVTETRYHLVTRAPAVTGRDIALAYADHVSSSQVIIKLTPSGGKKMEAFTRSLKAGRDMVVTIVDGKVINAATLQSEVLGQNFAISGLDDLNECETLTKGLSSPMENETTLVEERTISTSLRK